MTDVQRSDRLEALFDLARFERALITAAIGRQVTYRQQVDSTMPVARSLAEAGAPNGSLVLAEEQTAGRGRQGRSFYSPPGENLYFTIVIRGAPATLGILALAAPAAVCRALRALGAEAAIKWPNDIWIRGRKACGMLIDTELSGEEAIGYLGIGINVNGDPRENAELRESATSVRLALGHMVVREDLLAAICNRLEAYLGRDTGSAAAAPQGALLRDYRADSLVLGREVVVTPRGGESYLAEAADIEPDGALLVRRLGSRTPERIYAAEVSLRPRSVTE